MGFMTGQGADAFTKNFLSTYTTMNDQARLAEDQKMKAQQQMQQQQIQQMQMQALQAENERKAGFQSAVSGMMAPIPGMDEGSAYAAAGANPELWGEKNPDGSQDITEEGQGLVDSAMGPQQAPPVTPELYMQKVFPYLSEADQIKMMHDQMTASKPKAPNMIELEQAAMDGDMRAQALLDRLNNKKINEQAGGIDMARLSKASSPEEAWSILSPGQQMTVKRLLEGTEKPPTAFAKKSGYYQGLMQVASMMDPNFDEASYETRYKTIQDFKSGKQADNILALNTAAGHIDSLDKMAKTLGNYNNEYANSAMNLKARLGLTESDRVRQANIVGMRTKWNAVTGELASIFKKNGATDQEIKSWQSALGKDFDPAKATPDQIKGFIQSAEELMASRLEAAKMRYEQGVGRAKDIAFLSPESRQTLAKYGMKVDEIDPVTAIKPFALPEMKSAARIGGDSGSYDPMINQAAQVHGVQPELIKAIAKNESNFKPDAISRAGAVGIMQLMPGTAKDMGVLDRNDPAQSVHGGTKYIGLMMQKFGDLPSAIAAYNAGPAKVELLKKLYPSDWQSRLPAETKAYVSSVLRTMKEYQTGSKADQVQAQVMPADGGMIPYKRIK